MPAEQPLRRNRDFRALWTGQAASALGTSISGLAYPLVILAVTGSPTLAGLARPCSPQRRSWSGYPPAWSSTASTASV